MTSSARARPMSRARCWTPPAPGITPNPRLRLSEIARLSRGEAHVACQHELAAGAAHATLDLCDRDKAALAQAAKHDRDRRLPSQPRRIFAVLFDPRHIDMGDEIIGIGAPEYQPLDSIGGLRLPNEGVQVTDQFGPKRFMGGVEISANRTALPSALLSSGSPFDLLLCRSVQRPGSQTCSICGRLLRRYDQRLAFFDDIGGEFARGGAANVARRVDYSGRDEQVFPADSVVSLPSTSYSNVPSST